MQAKEKVPIINCRGIGFNILKGATLKSRFKVLKLLDKGSFGKIYEVIDIYSTRKVILKIQEDKKMISREINTLEKLNVLLEQYRQKGYEDGIPTLIDYGSVALTNFCYNRGSI